jgi:hypothetical protein
MAFYYEGYPIDIVSKFSYLVIVCTSGGPFNTALDTLAGKGFNAIFKLDKYLYKLTYILPRHKLACIPFFKLLL